MLYIFLLFSLILNHLLNYGRIHFKLFYLMGKEIKFLEGGHIAAGPPALPVGAVPRINFVQCTLYMYRTHDDNLIMNM